MDADLCLRIEQMPPLPLPHVFDDGAGGGKLDALSINCAGCRKKIHTDSDDIRGEITKLTTNSLNVNLTAYAICYDCKTITPLEGRFCADGTMYLKGPEGWKQGRWGAQKTVGWVGRLKAFLGVK